MMKKIAMAVALALSVASIGPMSDASAAGRRMWIPGGHMHGHHFGGRDFGGNRGIGAGLGLGAGLVLGGIISNDYYDESYAGSCNWLRIKAHQTGGQYWWHRYEACING